MKRAWTGVDIELSTAQLCCRPLAPDRWPDLEALFGPNGAQSGCWCMYWRRAGREWSDNATNRLRFLERVETQPPPGILGYLDDRPVGWAQVGPRHEFERIERSRNLAPPDDRSVWSLNCFVVHRSARRKGVAGALVTAAVGFARHYGAEIVEAYPVDRSGAASGELYTGTPGMFERADFVEVARHHPSRPIVRLTL
jgi:GNAT superfamily N-acetyltransferase